MTTSHKDLPALDPVSLRPLFHPVSERGQATIKDTPKDSQILTLNFGPKMLKVWKLEVLEGHILLQEIDHPPQYSALPVSSGSPALRPSRSPRSFRQDRPSSSGTDYVLLSSVFICFNFNNLVYDVIN